MVNLVFVFSGLISVCMQTLLLREMLVVFQGNELSIGLILSHWLLGVAFGSYAAGLLRVGRIRSRRGLLFTFYVISVTLFVAFLGVRYLRRFLDLFPGEGISLGVTMWSSFIVFFPLSTLVGAQFSLGVNWIERLRDHKPASRIYLWESVGYLIGGIVFTYIFIRFLNTPAIICVLAIFCLIAVIVITISKEIRIVFASLALLICIALPFISGALQKNTLQDMYGGLNILEVKHSPYGQIAVAEKDRQRYFLLDGIPLRSLPDTDIQLSEEFAHMAMLFHKDPKTVLLIGGAGKYIPTVLKHPVQHLDYIEIDPLLIKTLQKYWPKDVDSELNDPRLNIHYYDGRYFLKKTDKKYDLILIGLSYPVTLSLNRFFTKEFFALAKKKLNSSQGLVALQLPGSLVYIEDSLAGLIKVIENTMKTSFSSVEIVPGEASLFLASNIETFPAVKEIKKRFLDRNLDTQFLSNAYIDYRMEPAKKQWLYEMLTENKERGQATFFTEKSSLSPYFACPLSLFCLSPFFPESAYSVNRDFAPYGLMASLMRWQAVFSPKFAVLYRTIAHYSWILWIVVFLWFISGKGGYIGTAFTSGAAGMGLQMVSIWALQVYSGHIYHWIGLLSALFMAGMAFGSWIVRKIKTPFNVPKTVLKIEVGFCLWILFWYVLIKFSLVAWQILFFFSLGSGILLGMEFPLITSQKAAHLKTTESFVAGRIYASDLLGGWLSAFLGGTVLIPVWGFNKTMIFILVLKAVTLRWWARVYKRIF